MGVVFFLTLFPIIIAILSIAAIIAVIGIAVVVVGVSGGIVSATALHNKSIKMVSLFFFATLLLLGASCLAALAGIFLSVTFFIAPMLTIIGAAIVALSIVGIIKAFTIENKASKVAFIVLLILSGLLGAIVLAIGVFVLVVF